MALLYLVRHAKAGERRVWNGDDRDRPLSKKGHKQSELIGRRLATLKPTVLWSSPYVRCIETLEPLGEQIKLPVEVEQRLCEFEPVAPLLDLLATAPDGAVMCSHGDLIPAAVQRLERSGTTLRTPPDWRKSSVWVLKRNRRDAIVHATVWPPPVV